MRLPYVQITMEVIELSAPELAILLDAEEALVGWGLVRLVRWALARCPDDGRPPSAHATIGGPAAARLVASAAGWPGDPDTFVDACAALPFPILERVAGGVRIRGLSRYDAAWAKNRPAEAKAWRESSNGSAPPPPQQPAEPAPAPGRNRAGTGAKSAPQIQTQIQTQKEAEETTSSASPPPAAPSGEVRDLRSGKHGATRPPGQAERLTREEIQQGARDLDAAFALVRPTPDTLPASRSELAREVFAYWQRQLGHPRAKLGDRDRKRIEARLREGYSVADLKRVVDGCRASPHHMGKNDSRTVYDSLGLLFRDAGKVAEFIAKAPEQLELDAPRPDACSVEGCRGHGPEAWGRRWCYEHLAKLDEAFGATGEDTASPAFLQAFIQQQVAEVRA